MDHLPPNVSKAKKKKEREKQEDAAAAAIECEQRMQQHMCDSRVCFCLQ